MTHRFWYHVGYRRGQRGCDTPIARYDFPDAEGLELAAQGFHNGRLECVRQPLSAAPQQTNAELPETGPGSAS